MKTCCVVIPLHTMQFNTFEYASILQTIRILRKFDIYVVCPNHLNAEYFKSFGVQIKKFDDIWFKSIRAYNRLCMQLFFYEEFQQYDYMLKVEADAWIFKDELQFWCEKGYDYIGAPWCHFCEKFRTNCQYNEKAVNNNPIIGNGGFNLRKISKFIDVVQMLNTSGELDNVSIDDTENEDFFFMNHKDFSWNIPKCHEAAQFSIEGNAILHINNGIMPFGCHKLLNISHQSLLMLYIESSIQTNMQYMKQYMK